MPKIQFFLGKSKGADFEVKRPVIVEESKVQSNYTENDPRAPSHILNRPFYSETVTEPLEITWDGVWGGRPYMAMMENAAFVKLSDTVFDLEQLKDSYVTIFSSYGDLPNATIPFSSLEVISIDLGSGISYMILSDGLPVFAILTNDVFFEGNSYEKGTYFGIVRLSDSAEGDYSIYTSSLSFPSVTYTKYYKLDNNFVDAEWMATESTGVGTKKFSLVNFSDALAVGGVVQGFPVVQLDSRPYTEEELRSARLTFDVENTPLAWVVVSIENAKEFNILVATMLGFSEDGTFYLLSVEEGGFFNELPLKKGLYIFADVAIDFSGVSNITLEIFNATGQPIPNKLPNKFLDMDWIPKADTYTELLYEGTIKGEGSESIPFDQQLLDLDTTLLLRANGVTIEARAAGSPLLGVFYVFTYTESEFIAVTTLGTSASLVYNVAEPMTDVSIKIVKKAANPIPRHFLPEGIGNKVVVAINHPLADGLGGYEKTIMEAWNSGSTVELQFSDYTLSVLSFELTIDGVEATAVTSLGRYYRFGGAIEYGWALNTNSTSEDPASVLFKAEGTTEFVPTPLSSTLTEGSTLPAQEGAVFTAIQELQNTIGTLNQDLENRLNGGT